MVKQKMTIHRALSELKLIDSKIERQISEIEPSGVYQKGKLINNYVKPKEGYHFFEDGGNVTTPISDDEARLIVKDLNQFCESQIENNA